MCFGEGGRSPLFNRLGGRGANGPIGPAPHPMLPHPSGFYSTLNKPESNYYVTRRWEAANAKEGKISISKAC